MKAAAKKKRPSNASKARPVRPKDQCRRKASVSFELATPADDDELRALLRRTPMGGAIRLRFEREPSYLDAAAIQGDEVQVIVARAGGEIVGVATRALRPERVNGELVTAGYLSDLRILPGHRGGLVLSRGFGFLRELHADGRAQVYTTVIVEDNRAALATLAANRAGLPRYTNAGRVLTPMLELRRRLPELPLAADERIARGTTARLPAIVAKLNQNRLQFAPIRTAADFEPGGGLPGLAPEDFYLLWRGERLAAVLAVWDQGGFRQTVVDGYGPAVAALRPLINLVRRPPLPASGRPLTYAHVAMVSSDDVRSFAVLLRRACNDAVLAGRRRLIVGMHERDARARVLEDYPRTRFAGRLFAVTFEGAPGLDERVPYVEAALL